MQRRRMVGGLIMDATESAEFLARRDAADTRVEAKAGTILTPAQAAKLRGRGKEAAKPKTKAAKGKPSKASARPWRRDVLWLQAFAAAQAKYTTLAIEAALASRPAESEKLSLAHYNSAGDCVAELKRDGGRVFLRMGDASVTAEAESERASELVARFDAIGRELVP